MALVSIINLLSVKGASEIGLSTEERLVSPKRSLGPKGRKAPTRQTGHIQRLGAKKNKTDGESKPVKEVELPRDKPAGAVAMMAPSKAFNVELETALKKRNQARDSVVQSEEGVSQPSSTGTNVPMIEVEADILNNPSVRPGSKNPAKRSRNQPQRPSPVAANKDKSSVRKTFSVNQSLSDKDEAISTPKEAVKIPSESPEQPKQVATNVSSPAKSSESVNVAKGPEVIEKKGRGERPKVPQAVLEPTKDIKADVESTLKRSSNLDIGEEKAIADESSARTKVTQKPSTSPQDEGRRAKVETKAQDQHFKDESAVTRLEQPSTLPKDEWKSLPMVSSKKQFIKSPIFSKLF